MDTNKQYAAFITGSSRGIGRGIALTLAANGFNIALNGTAESPALQQTYEELKQFDVKVTSVPGDVSRIEDHSTMLERAEKVIGPLTTLVNNAGVSVLKRGDLLEVTPESYDRCLAINTRAPFFLSQAFARCVINRASRPDVYHSIINITSANSVAAVAARGEYCVSKAGAAMMSKVFAVRLAANDICVFDVQPGIIRTDMTQPVIDTYNKRIQEEDFTLIKRIGEPEDIGIIVATLASGGMPYVTGQEISADAGLVLPRF